MLRTLRPALVLTVVALAALACEGGSVLNTSMRCSGDQCEGSVQRLTGSFTFDVTSDAIGVGDAVPVTVEVTSDTGRVEVSMTAPDGTKASGVAAPGAPVTVAGVATGMLITVDEGVGFEEEDTGQSSQVGGFQIVLTALDESAENVTYRLTYSAP